MSSWVCTLLRPGVGLHKPASLGWWCSSLCRCLCILHFHPPLCHKARGIWNGGFCCRATCSRRKCAVWYREGPWRGAGLPPRVGTLKHTVTSGLPAVFDVALKLPPQSAIRTSRAAASYLLTHYSMYRHAAVSPWEIKENALYCYWTLRCMQTGLLAEKRIISACKSEWDVTLRAHSREQLWLWMICLLSSADFKRNNG